MSFLMLITHTHMSWYCICVQCLCLRYILFDLKSRMDVIISLCVITDTASIYYQQCKQSGHINVATLHICTLLLHVCAIRYINLFAYARKPSPTVWYCSSLWCVRQHMLYTAATVYQLPNHFMSVSRGLLLMLITNS